MQRALLVPFVCILMILTSHASRAAEPLLVTGNPEAPPIVWQKSGKLVGVGPEAVSRILENLHVPFTIKNTGSWKQVQEKAKNGTVDLIVSAYKNKERQQYMAFSDPYLKSPVVIVVKKGNKFPFTFWDALIGKKGVANTGESFGEKFDAFIQNKLDVSYMPYERAFEMMKLGTADYMVIDLYPAIIYSKLLNVEDKVEFLDNPATVQQFHIAVSKKSPAVDLLPKINAQISTLKKKGYFTALVKEQYDRWNETFQRRLRFYARTQQRNNEEQRNYTAGAHDRGLDNLARFIERDRYFMNGTNLME
ncbi:MAG TPA: transporter substrate-binding domain-containing protein [Desulfobulbus sp.]|nr:transporter substrate-binding domain-containing protein [Desulfobulbus sp.]